MTEQEIIGAMKHFYISEEKSVIANFHAEQVSDLPEILGMMGGSHEVALKNKHDEKLFSTRSFTGKKGLMQYLSGSVSELDSDDFLSDLEFGRIVEITKEEYLHKYHELEEE